jgi:hypothetical protein
LIDLQIFVIFLLGISILKVLVLRRYLSTRILCLYLFFTLLWGMSKRFVKVINYEAILLIKLELSSYIIIIILSR